MMLHPSSSVHSISKEGEGVINELIQGKELACQLRNQLTNSSSLDSRRFLITQILKSYENALSMLNSNGLSAEETKSDFEQSPKSENSKKESANMRTKKRRTSEKVKICVGTEQESVDDGYFWRKYGQKEILNSKYPRMYFRCTHRFSHECLATKQVQRLDDDPAVLKVTYVGNHTCTSVSSSTTSTISSSSCEKKLTKIEEPLSSFCEFDERKDIFRTFSFSDVQFNDMGMQENVECLEWNDIMERFPPANVEDFDLSFLDFEDFSFDACL